MRIQLIILFYCAILNSVVAATSYRINHGATVSINEFGTCKSVTNNHATIDKFISTNSSTAWASFYNNPPADMSVAACGGGEDYAPVVSDGNALMASAVGMNLVQNLSVDDSALAVTLPFGFYHAGTSYTNWYVGSNTYLTAGTGASTYSGLGGSTPPYPKFHLGSSDNSYQRVYTKAGTNSFTIRYEGTASTNGAIGSPNIVYEFTFYKPYSGIQYAQVVFGMHGRVTGPFGVASGAAYYANHTPIAVNSSYVFQSNTNGTSWTMTPNKKITGPGTSIGATIPAAAPTGASALGGGNLTVASWGAVVGAGAYYLYWRTSPGVTIANGSKIVSANNSYIHTGLTSSTTYYYIVTAANAAGEGPASAEFSATVPAVAPVDNTGFEASNWNGWTFTEDPGECGNSAAGILSAEKAYAGAASIKFTAGSWDDCSSSGGNPGIVSKTYNNVAPGVLSWWQWCPDSVAPLLYDLNWNPLFTGTPQTTTPGQWTQIVYFNSATGNMTFRITPSENTSCYIDNISVPTQ